MLRRLALLALIAAFLAAGCREDPGPDPAGSQAVTGRPLRATLTALSGDVRVRLADAADYVTAAKGRGLAIGDTISTGASGHATLTFNDGSTAVITPHSLVTIEPPANTAADGIGVKRGRVEVEIVSATSGFEVRTPGATLRTADSPGKSAAGGQEE